MRKLALRMALLAVPLLAAWLWCSTASAAVINATFDSGYDVDGGIRRACAQATIDQWESTITSDITFANAVRFRIVDLGTSGILAATTIASGGYQPLMAEGLWSSPEGVSGFVEYGFGIPLDPWGSDTYVTIDLNSVKLGQMFFGGPADPVPGGQYDALTLFRHELGHAVGFSVAYADFAAKLTDGPGANRTYNGNDFTVELTGAGQGTHVLDSADLMSAYMGTGVRQDVSDDPDLKILMDAYGYTTPEPATLALAAIGLAGALAARRRRAAA